MNTFYLENFNINMSHYLCSMFKPGSKFLRATNERRQQMKTINTGCGNRAELDPWVTLHVLKLLAEYITKTQCQVFFFF